jgi:hypothetical protein
VPKLFSKLVSPWYPSTAIGLEKGSASLVQLERGRNNAPQLRRAANIRLEESLLKPDFHESNVADLAELAGALNELAASAGLLKQKRWSVTLPEATVRTAILTLETTPGSSSELEEVLTWKIERGFGVSLDELSISRERLSADAQGRERYLVVAARTAVLDEYEKIFGSLGWRTGLLLPRHMGEAQWLTMNGAPGDSLLLSSSAEGFTAVVFRGKQPLILRSITCEPQDCEDEFYRLLLFYSDRRTSEHVQPLSRLMIVGDAFPKDRATEIANETLETNLRPLAARDLGLELPSRDISFDAIAAPAGLASLSWQ